VDSSERELTMKKRLLTLIAVAGLLCLNLAGCSNSNVDTAKVRAALQSLDAGQKDELETALTAIDAGKFKEALLPLKKIGYGAKLTKDQSKVVRDTLRKVEAKIANGQ
jgi:hypothetical protein